MVYMHFPAHLTEEEEMLSKKYAKLRKKKRLLQSLRSQQKQEPKQEQETPMKSSEEAANATAQAKKLLKSGAIKLSTEKKEHQGFKRSKRLKEGGEKSAVVFQPYSGPEGAEDRPEVHDPNRPSSPTSPHPNKRKRLYESFVSSRESKDTADEGGSSEGGGDERGDSDREHRRDRSREDFRRRDRPFRDRPFRDRGPDRDVPQRGNTIHIRGHGITEDLLRQTFSNFGNILNVSMEQEKKVSCGFLTFEKMESADEAITQMNGTVVGEAQLRVSMARRQPTFEVNSSTAATEGGDPASTESWSTIAANKGQLSHRDSRDMVMYSADDDIF